jgi:two-component system, NtrC family, response regulator PilR
MESELFGHVKGAFTGASRDHKGLFEAAHRGSIFLDEIGELSPALQVKLLRVLQERRIKLVGGVGERDVDVRVIAATNKVLETEVREGRFREDLYYRLNVITIHLPPLRDRREDIPLIADHFLRKYTKEMGKEIRGFTGDALRWLSNYRYEGNVRELENIIERAVTFEMTDAITTESLPGSVSDGHGPLRKLRDGLFLPPEGVDVEALLAEIEQTYLRKALDRAGGVKTEAAKLLGISFRSIRYKLDKYGIETDGGDDVEFPSS